MTTRKASDVCSCLFGANGCLAFLDLLSQLISFIVISVLDANTTITRFK